MTMVAGGNVQTTGQSINPHATKSVGWKWIEVKGRPGRRHHWWFQEAIKQGVEITRGTYHFNWFTGHLRALNIQFTGETALIDSMKASIDRL